VAAFWAEMADFLAALTSRMHRMAIPRQRGKGLKVSLAVNCLIISPLSHNPRSKNERRLYRKALNISELATSKKHGVDLMRHLSKSEKRYFWNR